MENKHQNPNYAQQQYKHAFHMNQNATGPVSQYTADSQLASSGLHFKLTANPQTTSGSSSIFSGTDHTNQGGQHPYQQYGREHEMPPPYSYGGNEHADVKTTERENKIKIQNYEEQAMHGQSIESQPSAHFYQPLGLQNQQSLPTERYSGAMAHQHPMINVQVSHVGPPQSTLSQTGTSSADDQVKPFSFNAKSQSSIKMTKKQKDRKNSAQNLDVSPTLGPPSRGSERKRRLDTELPDLSVTTMNDQSQADISNTISHTQGDASGITSAMVSARSNTQTGFSGLKRGPTTIGQKVGIKIICRIAPTKALNRQLPTNSRQSLSSSRQSSSRVAVNAAQHIYLEGVKNLESPQAIDKNLIMGGHSSIRSTNNYLNTGQSSSPSARGSGGRQGKFCFRASSTDNQQILNSEKRKIFQYSSKQSDKKAGKRGGSHMRNLKLKSDSLMQTGGFKNTQSKELNEEGNYSIFTTRNQSRFVLACDQPFSGRLLNEVFADIEDVKQLQSIQQNSLGQPQTQSQPVIFKFDGVHDETLAGRQDKVYKQNVQPIVHNFIEGQNGTVLLFGPTASGKTYTLKGGQGSERGMVPRAVDEILQLTKGTEAGDHRELDRTPSFLNNQAAAGVGANKIFLKVSIYMVTSHKIVDLIANKGGKFGSFQNSSKEREKEPHLQHYYDQQQNAVMSQVMDLNERLILCPEDFYIALADAFRTRKELSLSEFRDKDIRKKSHFIIGFTLMQQQQNTASQKFMQISQLNFVELSGSEQAVNQMGSTQFDQIRDTVVQQFVSKSFNSLSCHLMKLVQRKRSMQSNQKPGSNNVLGSGDDEESKLVACLRQTMTATSNVLLVNCVEPSPFMIEHSLPSLKFCSSLREHIKKKMKRVPKEKAATAVQKTGKKSNTRAGSRAKSKSKSRSRSKNKEGSSNSKSARKLSIGGLSHLDYVKVIKTKIDRLKINLMNQEQSLEQGNKDAVVIQKLGELLLECQALQKELENQQASGHFKGQDIKWSELTESITYVNNKILGLICTTSQQQQQMGTMDSSTQPVTQRNTAVHTAQPSQTQFNIPTPTQSELTLANNNHTSNPSGGQNFIQLQAATVPTMQTGQVPHVSIPSSTNMTSSHVQTTNPAFSVNANTRNSEYNKFGTTGQNTGTNYDNGSLQQQSSIDNRAQVHGGNQSINQHQLIQGPLGPIMSEREHTSPINDRLPTSHQMNEGDQATQQRYENNETFSDNHIGQGQQNQQQMFHAAQNQNQMQQQDNPYKNNFSNRKGSLGMASNSSNAGNHYDSFQNNNVPGIQGMVGFTNQQQFNTVDNRQLGDLNIPSQNLSGIPLPTGQPQYNIQHDANLNGQQILDNMHQRTNSRSRANMNSIWQKAQQPHMNQQDGGTIYRTNREDSYDRIIHPHMGQQQRISTTVRSSGEKMYNANIDQSNQTARTEHYNNQSSAYKHMKYKNLVQSFESKFNQIRRDLPKPEFVRESDLPDQQRILDDLKASGNDFKLFEEELSSQIMKYFDDFRKKSLTYQSEDELKGDVSRLMLLNDQEGLKLRFSQLYRERDSVINHAKEQIQRGHPIERQKTILQIQLNQVMQHFVQNTEQFTGYLSLIEERYQETEAELMEEIRDKVSIIDSMQENKIQLEETIDQLKKQADDAVSQQKEDHKHRLETDSKMKEVADENAKLRQNYDVLKEHEMSIIRDCENRKQAEIKAQQEIVIKEREVNAEQFQKIEQMKIEISELQSKLRASENENKINESEKNTYHDRSDTYANEIQNLNHEISSLKQKACEDIELIKIMRQNAETLKKEKQDQVEKILTLQRAVKTNEQSNENQHHMYQKVQGEVKMLEQDLEQLRADKTQLKDQMKNLKNEHTHDLTQKDLVIQKVKDEVEELNRKMETQQQLIAARNDELITIKAKQFDKVDLLQKLSETEGKLKQLEEENNKLLTAKDESQSKCDYLQSELNKFQQINEQLRMEIEKMRKQQDSDFDQFDNKFDELNRQVERFTQENTALKDKIQQHREEVREAEKQKSYWRDKCRVAEKKGDQINQKIVELENELRSIIFERNHKQSSTASEMPPQSSSAPYLRKTISSNERDQRSEYFDERPQTFKTLETGKPLGFGGAASHQAGTRSRPPLMHHQMPNIVKQDPLVQAASNRNALFDLETRPSENIRIENESGQAQIMGTQNHGMSINNNNNITSPEMSRSSSVSNSNQHYENNMTKNSEPPLRSSKGQHS